MSELIPKWLLEDNEERDGKYSRDLTDEVFLRMLNNLLNESEIISEKDQGTQPVIFFFGVPRCGKTFFSQMMTHLLDLGYPDNVVARFWRAPNVGIRLSNILRKAVDAEISFISDHGKTKGIFDPHDFAYFWHEHLNMKNLPYDYVQAKSEIDWSKLNQSLTEFTTAFGKSCIMKGVNPSYHLNEIAEAYEKSFFIYVKRDFIDSAVSLYRGRLKNYGDLSKWYGQTPTPELYNELLGLPHHMQIGGQFKYLSELYESQLERMDSSRYLVIDYKEFCQDPVATAQSIVKKIEDASGVKIEFRNELRKGSVKYSSHSKELPFYSELLKGLEEFGLSPTMN